MTVAIVLGVVATSVALLGLLGRKQTGEAWPAQIIVYALPLGIVAAGYSASIGINLGWTLVAGLSIFLAVLAGGLTGQHPALADRESKPVAAGLNLALTGLISVGLAVIVLLWASHLMSAFSYLDGFWVRIVLVGAAVAYSIGGRSSAGLSRTILVLIIIGAVAMFGIGFVAGDTSGLTAPQVPVPPLSPVTAVLYAVGVIIIGAGYPVLRASGNHNRARVWTAAVVLALVVVVTLVGILMLYGGAFQLPSLVINVLPVYSPPVVSAVICGLLAIISTVVVGAAINAAAGSAAQIEPSWYKHADEHPAPRRRVAIVLGVAVLVLAWLEPTPQALVAVLAVLGFANLIAEWIIRRNHQPHGRASDAVGSEDSPATDSAGADVPDSASDADDAAESASAPK
ncbi:MAG: hypothetical protein ACOYD0_07035 [Candidatus Nanopelagicales bacterium]